MILHVILPHELALISMHGLITYSVVNLLEIQCSACYKGVS